MDQESWVEAEYENLQANDYDSVCLTTSSGPVVDRSQRINSLGNLESETEDIYDSSYLAGPEYSFLEVVPNSDSFEEYFKNVITFAHNFKQLRANDMPVPEFEAGVEIIEGDMKPYFLMEYPGNDTVDQFLMKNFTGDDSIEIFEQMAEVREQGEKLSREHKILYLEAYEFRDMRARRNPDQQTFPDINLVNPGSYHEDILRKQLGDSELKLEWFDVEMMSEESFWENVLE